MPLHSFKLMFAHWSLKKIFPFEELFNIDRALKFVEYQVPLNSKEL